MGFNGNLNTQLRRRRRASDPMRDYDRLPKELRSWLSAARLPWSPSSALKIWNKAGGCKDPDAALARLALVEKATLDREGTKGRSAPS